MLKKTKKTKLSWSNLTRVYTDGALSMLGKEKALVGLMKKREGMSTFVSFYCITHQESLVSKLRNKAFQSVIQTVVHAVNFIVSRALNRRQLRQLIKDYDMECGDLVMHNEVRCLSLRKVLKRFLSLLPEIHTFLDNKGRHEQQMEDPLRIMQLAFLTNISSYLNALNLQLQGKR